MNIKCFEFNFLPVNTYIIWDDTLQAAIIDPGCFYQDEPAVLEKFISSMNLQVKLLLNTHLHFDHVFGNTFVEDKYGVQAMCNDADNGWITDMSNRLAAFGIRHTGRTNPIKPENVLRDGDTVTFGNTTLLVRQIPGHSPGSVVYIHQESQTVFTGNVLFCNGVGRSDFPDGDGRALNDGIISKLMTLPDATKVYPGHGPATTIGSERRNFMY